MRKKSVLFMTVITLGAGALLFGGSAAATDTHVVQGLLPLEEQAEFLSEAAEDMSEAAGEGGSADVVFFSKEMEDAIASMSVEEIQEKVEAVTELLSSPEVRELLEYEEVRDLAETVLKRVLDLAVNEPELTSKVLETLGVSKEGVYLYLKLSQTGGEAAEVVSRITESEEGRQVLDKAQELASDEKVRSLLGNWYQDLLGEGQPEAVTEEAMSE